MGGHKRSVDSWQQDLVRTVTSELVRMAASAPDHSKLSGPETQATLEEEMSSIAQHLVTEALARGLVSDGTPPTLRRLPGGRTALAVSIASLSLTFVLKIADLQEDDTGKLLREARTIEDLRTDKRLGAFAAGLPRIFAVHSGARYIAYLMEHFPQEQYVSITDILFARNPPDSELAVRIVDSAIDALADAYRESRDPRLAPRMMAEAYFARLKNALEFLEKLPDAGFVGSRPLVLNHRKLAPWRKSLETLNANSAQLQAIAPPFVSVVHGDPNPGNILIKLNGQNVADIKFIDLKDWKLGDYVFDIAKLTHYLLHTGPIEEFRMYANFSVAEEGERSTFNYQELVPDYIKAAVKAAEAKLSDLAAEFNDNKWELRYKLAMASNLVGLAPKRYSNGRREEATILAAQGLAYLDDFVAQFS